jgi:hypothetical protein
MKKFARAVCLFGIVALTACSSKNESAADDLAYAAPACAYQIKDAGGELVPVNSQGQRIGVFERHPDGVVQLTTPAGYAPGANECIKRAGFEAMIGSVRPYAKSAT